MAGVDAAAVSDNYRLMAARCEASEDSVAGYRGWWWAQVARNAADEELFDRVPLGLPPEITAPDVLLTSCTHYHKSGGRCLDCGQQAP
jgi:hypothetical protein